MIRGNLATRPFYNERAVHGWMAAATLVLLGLTAYNAMQILHYSQSDADLRRQAIADEARALELTSAAAALQQSGDVRQGRLTSAAAAEANQVIAQRTFSWSTLLSHFEEALPPDVRITSVRPASQADMWRPLVISVVARSVPAIDTFLQNLEDTGAFRDALSRDEHVNEVGDLEAAIEVHYSPGAAEASQ
jgi:Tfp pilus assembly protein PilN